MSRGNRRLRRSFGGTAREEFLDPSARRKFVTFDEASDDSRAHNAS